MEAARAYYNEIDPAACAVLRQLIADGVIAPGEVDTRSIKEVQPDDLRGFTQCHFFAGGGLWSVAARMAGWPDDRPLWTGSCPCQPFSAAGKGLGTDDPRHLWPDFHRLIRACRPPHVMGEQVAGAAGYGWLDGVRADLASEGYASRGVDIPACAIDAPHQRNRLYWIAAEHAESERRGEGRPEYELRGRWPAAAGADASGHAGNGVVARLEGQPWHGDGGRRPETDRPAAEADGTGTAGIMADSAGAGRVPSALGGIRGQAQGEWPWDGEPQRLSSRNGSYWADAEWIVCHDGKARRTKPGLRLLVDELPGRVDLWRVGGNAIVPVLAAEVIGAFLDAEEDLRAAA
jgi:DNA (cytosine-5)-methyltransferase 1